MTQHEPDVRCQRHGDVFHQLVVAFHPPYVSLFIVLSLYADPLVLAEQTGDNERTAIPEEGILEKVAGRVLDPFGVVFGHGIVQLSDILQPQGVNMLFAMEAPSQ